MVEQQPSKLMTRVRFPSPAPASASGDRPMPHHAELHPGVAPPNKFYATLGLMAAGRARLILPTRNRAVASMVGKGLEK